MFVRQKLGLLLLLAAAALPGYCRQNSHADSLFSIDGSVRDISDQHGMENIRVDLKQPDGSPVSSTFTKDNGVFEFMGIANGEYLLEVNAQDYEPLDQSVEIKNDGRRGVSLLLTRALILLNSNTRGAVISAHQLSVPRKAQDEFNKGMNLLYAKTDYRGAIAQFQRAIKDFPTYYEAYALEGTSYQSLGEMPSAEEALRKAVDLSSGKYSEALYLLSALLLNAKRYQEAATLARKCVEVDTSSWQGPFELARALFGLQQFDEAEKSANLAREKNPDYPDVHILLANIHIARRDFPLLAADLDAYLKISPNGPDVDWVRQTQERMQEARKQQEEMDARKNARAKAHAGGQNQDGTDASDSDEPDASDLPPLPPPTPTNP
ncbi:MAG: tetratricopeptide repeat protein [Acidobacteriia bacterium]|nr:tetratricopeptide repeat protein [Terriglobia bacterium]